MTSAADNRLAVPERHDDRPRLRRLIAPVGAAGGAVLACAYLAFVDPNEPGHYPLCPLRAVLGWDCPGCGGLRGMHALLTGDPMGALDHNVLLVVVVPFTIWMWVRWLIRTWRGVSPQVTVRDQRRWTVATVAILGLALVFGVVRNFVPYLGSAA